jgi:ethanolamine utilization cobalamin adenosyltransferase
MVCAIERAEGVVLVSPSTRTVFTTTPEHLDRLKRKPDGHYDRDELMTLVKEGRAVVYDEKVVRTILRAAEYLAFGCPPWA